MGREDGATLVCGERRPATGSIKAFRSAHRFRPRDARHAYRAKRSSVGLGIIRVKSFEEAMQVANDTEFGLSSSIFTNDVGHMFRLSKKSRPA